MTLFTSFKASFLLSYFLGCDGRCGMAAITLKDHTRASLTSEELAEIYTKCEDLLASYARPRFLRVQKYMEVTSTFKQQKPILVKQGFDPSQCQGETLYCLLIADRKFIPLDQSVFEKVNNGDIRM